MKSVSAPPTLAANTANTAINNNNSDPYVVNPVAISRMIGKVGGGGGQGRVQVGGVVVLLMRLLLRVL
jgi:hypothetical protein